MAGPVSNIHVTSSVVSPHDRTAPRCIITYTYITYSRRQNPPPSTSTSTSPKKKNITEKMATPAGESSTNATTPRDSRKKGRMPGSKNFTDHEIFTYIKFIHERLPTAFGDWDIVYKEYNKWAESSGFTKRPQESLKKQWLAQPESAAVRGQRHTYARTKHTHKKQEEEEGED